MYQSILVPLDGSALSEQALPVALGIARRAEAALHLAYVAHSLSTQPTLADLQAREYLDVWAGRLRDAGCQAVAVALLEERDVDQASVEMLSHARRIAAALHGHAVATGVDLVVMTTHSRSEAARLWLGSVTNRLVRELPVPILLVRPQHAPLAFGHGQTFRHVLIALDGSPQAEAVLEHAVALIVLMRARCTLLRAIDPLLAGHTIPPYAVGLTRQAVEQLQIEARMYLLRRAERLRALSIDVQTRVIVADPADAITGYAREQAVDLIAIATHGRQLLSQLILGSVAAKVVRDASAPILLYRPPPEARLERTIEALTSSCVMPWS